MNGHRSAERRQEVDSKSRRAWKEKGRENSICRRQRTCKLCLVLSAGGSVSLTAPPATDAWAQTEINPLWTRCQRTPCHTDPSHIHTRGTLTMGVPCLQSKKWGCVCFSAQMLVWHKCAFFSAKARAHVCQLSDLIEKCANQILIFPYKMRSIVMSPWKCNHALCLPVCTLYFSHVFCWLRFFAKLALCFQGRSPHYYGDSSQSDSRPALKREGEIKSVCVCVFKHLILYLFDCICKVSPSDPNLFCNPPRVTQIWLFNDSVSSMNHTETDLFKSDSGRFHMWFWIRYRSKSELACNPHQNSTRLLRHSRAMFFINVQKRKSWTKTIILDKSSLCQVELLDEISFTKAICVTTPPRSWLRLSIHILLYTRVAAIAPQRATAAINFFIYPSRHSSPTHPLRKSP